MRFFFSPLPPSPSPLSPRHPHGLLNPKPKNQVLELAQEMRTANLVMDGITANAIMMSHAMLREWDKALTFFEV